MEVRDKDPMFDDLLGECTIDLHELRGGQRHSKCISLNNIKKGRIHLAVTVKNVSEDKCVSFLDEPLRKADAELPLSTSLDSTFDAAELPEEKVFMDEMEQIDSDGQEQSGGLYVHRPSLGFQSHGNLEKDKHVTQAHRFTNRLKSRRKSPHQ